MQVIEHLKEHYEVQEVPFARTYKWCPECVVVECDCGARSILTAAMSICSDCGADHTVGIQQELQSHQPEMLGQMLEDYEATNHPWHHDTLSQDDQHQRDEAAYSKDSSWRYNDVTLGNMEENKT
jgi:hypothetical protein